MYIFYCLDNKVHFYPLKGDNFIGYGQLIFFTPFPFHSCAPCRAHQSRGSWRNSSPISAEVALHRLQSEIKVALFLFASHSFLANNLRFMVKLIVKN
jgi:hypothetical protein